MRNGNTEHDFDSIAELLRHQNAVLVVLLDYLAHVEAALCALTVQALPDENLRIAKGLKDHTQAQIYKEMMAEAKRNDEELSTNGDKE
jgi:hypothetical protein